MGKSDVFADIYQNGDWGDGSDNLPLSGSGSNPDFAAPYVNFVKEVIITLQISKVLDVGHGDWKMWRDYKFESIHYTGIDVVRELSQKLNLEFGREGRTFRSEIDSDFLELNDQLIICKDVLQHLSNSAVMEYLEKFSRSKYFVVCNDLYVKPKRRSKIKGLVFVAFSKGKPLLPFSEFQSKVYLNNSDIEDGDFRGVDLQASPFMELLRNFEVVSSFDFHAPKRYGLVKRVQFFRQLSSMQAN